MKHLTTLFLIACLACPLTAHAQDATEQGNKNVDGMRASYFACLKAADGVTPDMQDCIGTEYEYQDRRLNQAYKTLMTHLSKVEQDELRAEERKWIAYRDAYCELPPDAGQGQRLESNDCTMEQTAKRATLLEARQPAN